MKWLMQKNLPGRGISKYKRKLMGMSFDSKGPASPVPLFLKLPGERLSACPVFFLDIQSSKGTHLHQNRRDTDSTGYFQILERSLAPTFISSSSRIK